jgi:hypothetical protein
MAIHCMSTLPRILPALPRIILALPRVALGGFIAMALAGCGSSEVEDPVQAYLDSAEIASGVSVEPVKPLPQSVPIVRSRPLLQASRSVELIANGSFNDPAGPAAGWTQSTKRTLFPGLGDLIGPVPGDRPAHPALGRGNVARMCGYPATRTIQSPDGTIQTDTVTCVDRLTSDEFTVPAGATAVNLRLDAYGSITCGGTWTTVVALVASADGSKIPALQVRQSTFEPVDPANPWKTLSYTVPADRVAGMGGKSYRLIAQGMSGSCKDPQMEQSIVLLTGIHVTAN